MPAPAEVLGAHSSLNACHSYCDEATQLWRPSQERTWSVVGLNCDYCPLRPGWDPQTHLPLPENESQWRAHWEASGGEIYLCEGFKHRCTRHLRAASRCWGKGPEAPWAETMLLAGAWCHACVSVALGKPFTCGLVREQGGPSAGGGVAYSLVARCPQPAPLPLGGCSCGFGGGGGGVSGSTICRGPRGVAQGLSACPAWVGPWVPPLATTENKQGR